MIVREPTAVSVSAHAPAPTFALQLEPSSAVTCTVPSGAPPGDCTRNATCTASPGAEGSGLSDVISMVLGARASAMAAEVAPE